MLLCTWLSNCSIAVTHFLHNPANVPFVSLTCTQSRTAGLEIPWITHPQGRGWPGWVCRDTAWRERHALGQACQWELVWGEVCYRYRASEIPPFSLTRALAHRADSREPRGRGAAGPRPVCASPWHLHLLQRQLPGKLQEVSMTGK